MKNPQSKLGAKALWAALKTIIATEIASRGTAISGVTFTESDLQRFAGRKCKPNFMEKLETVMSLDEPPAYLSSIHALDTIIKGKQKSVAEPFFEISFDPEQPRISLSDYDQLGNPFATSISAILSANGLPPLDTTLRITEFVRPTTGPDEGQSLAEMVGLTDIPTLVKASKPKRGKKIKGSIGAILDDKDDLL